VTVRATVFPTRNVAAAGLTVNEDSDAAVMVDVGVAVIGFLCGFVELQAVRAKTTAAIHPDREFDDCICLFCSQSLKITLSLEWNNRELFLQSLG
jgi:hypothetical protein